MCFYQYHQSHCPFCKAATLVTTSRTCPSFSDYEEIHLRQCCYIQQTGAVVEPCTNCRTSDQQQLPVIVIVQTGGTITAKGHSPTDTTNYKAGAFGITHVIEPVKSHWEGSASVEIDCPFRFSIDSINLDVQHKLMLYRTVTRHMSRPEVIGVLVTSGTDEMAETAEYLDATIPNGPDKHVVFVGAHRPHTAPGADGPSSILAGIYTLLDSRWTGVVMVDHDNLVRPFGTKKIKGRFEPGSDSFLTKIRDFKPSFRDLPRGAKSQRRLPTHINVSGLSPHEAFPEVAIIPVQAGYKASQFLSVVRSGVKGVILEGFTTGWWPDNSKDEISKWANRDDVIIVMVSRYCSERVNNPGVEGVIPGGDWNRDQLLPVLQTVMMLKWAKSKIQELCLYPFESTVS